MKHLSATRREFLGWAGAFAALPVRRVFAGERPLLTLGLASDIHITATKMPSGGGNPAQRGTVRPFLKALKWFDAMGVDGVTVTGDMADWGIDTQLMQIAAAWEKVFPAGRAGDGRPVEKLFVYGNHDANEAFRYTGDRKTPRKHLGDLDAYAREHAIFGHHGEVWERVFREEWNPVWRKEVKGFTFIGAHWGHEDREAVDFVKKVLPGLDPSKPFFCLQHKTPNNTNWGDAAFDHDSGMLTELLRSHANAVVLSGHAHYSLTDERNVWQDGFTSIGCSTLSHTGKLQGRENSGGWPHKLPYPRQMKPIGGGSDGKQAMVMRVYADRFEIVRREFVWDESLGADWVLPFPAPKGGAFSHVRRAASFKAPEFPAGATATAKIIDGKDRDDVPTRQVVVEFPAVRSRSEDCRVFEYQVQALYRPAEYTRILADKRVWHSGSWRPLSHEMDGAAKTATCVFAVSELLPGVPVRFAVRPCDSLGNLGAPIFTPPIKMAKA